MVNRKVPFQIKSFFERGVEFGLGVYCSIVYISQTFFDGVRQKSVEAKVEGV